MSDVPPCAPVARLSIDVRRRAAITTCQFVNYDRDDVERFLLALGLIEVEQGRFVATTSVDGTVWCTSQASRARA